MPLEIISSKEPRLLTTLYY